MITKHSQSLSAKGMLDMGRELRGEHGKSLTLDLFCRETGLSPDDVSTKFGSWERFRRALGMTLPASSKERKFSAAELLAQLRRLAAENETLTLWQFCRQVGVSQKTICNRFGSWRNMREAAGLPRMAPRKPEYTDADLMDDLWQIYLKAGRCPEFHDLKRWGGKISATTFRARYGSWKGVRAGFELHRRETLQKIDPTWSWEKEREEKERKHSKQSLEQCGQRFLQLKGVGEKKE